MKTKPPLIQLEIFFFTDVNTLNKVLLKQVDSQEILEISRIEESTSSINTTYTNSKVLNPRLGNLTKNTLQISISQTDNNVYPLGMKEHLYLLYSYENKIEFMEEFKFSKLKNSLDKDSSAVLNEDRLLSSIKKSNNLNTEELLNEQKISKLQKWNNQTKNIFNSLLKLLKLESKLPPINLKICTFNKNNVFKLSTNFYDDLIKINENILKYLNKNLIIDKKDYYISLFNDLQSESILNKNIQLTLNSLINHRDDEYNIVYKEIKSLNKMSLLNINLDDFLRVPEDLKEKYLKDLLLLLNKHNPRLKLDKYKLLNFYMLNDFGYLNHVNKNYIIEPKFIHFLTESHQRLFDLIKVYDAFEIVDKDLYNLYISYDNMIKDFMKSLNIDNSINNYNYKVNAKFKVFQNKNVSYLSIEGNRVVNYFYYLFNKMK